jgi:hypothetical protein
MMEMRYGTLANGCTETKQRKWRSPEEVEIAVVRGPCVLAWQKKTTYTIPLVSCASTTTAWDNARRAGKDVEQEDSTCCNRSCFM